MPIRLLAIAISSMCQPGSAGLLFTGAQGVVWQSSAFTQMLSFSLCSISSMADVIDPMDLLHYGASDASLFTNESVAVRDASKNEFQSTSTS